MRFNGQNMIYTADDEFPNCSVCEKQDFCYLCMECGPSFAWQHYERSEDNAELNRLYKELERYKKQYD